PTGRRALACAPPPPPPPRPPRPPRPPFVALARATLCSPRGRAPTGPPAPLNRLPSTGTLARAAGGPSPTHTHRPRPAHHRARKRGRPTCAGRPRAARAAMCPSQLVTALRHQAAAARGSPRPSRPANWRESMEVEIPRGPAVTGAPPRLRRKVSGPPSKRPALPGPLMGGQQGYLTAYTTRLVTSVVCRGFIPARGDIAIRQPAPGGFSPGAVASLLRYMARRPIRIQLRRAGLHRRVPARILT
ncbi:hypothetical protein KXX61_006921, partial [Aspergillus fumigatus]